MALDTVSISDIGTSLIAIEAEIAANNSSIAYYNKQVQEYQNKNDMLREVVQALLKNAIPLSLGMRSNG